MNTFRPWVFCALFFSLFSPIFGQQNAPSNAHLVKTYTFFQNSDPRLNHQNFFEEMAGKMYLSAKSEMVLIEESTDKFGITHFKFQQFHEGLPIFGSRYILHEKDGRVLNANGRYSPQADANPQPGINAETAVAFAKRAMKAQAYHTRQADAVLCFIDPDFPEVSESLRLAYQVDLHSTEPFDKRRYFLDAITGKILCQFPLILNEGVPSTAKTRYYGIQHIITDSIGPQQIVLRDPTRGEGIFVLNNSLIEFTSTSSMWDLSSNPYTEVALDAHYCSQEYYDMMLSDYDWQGLDGNGKALNVRVNVGNFVNAFWDGEASFYGDGDCNYGPLTTLEVVGHEFTHGMIDYTSRLIYDSESGAINESLADLFGKLLERKADPGNFSWDLGHSFIINPESRPFRVMDAPNSVQMPAYYKGEYWFDGGDVHTNSAIGNLWFTMLVDGKQGTNEVGTSYNVPAIGAEKAGQIVFQVNRFYFTESSTYSEFYLYSQAVAEAMFGAGSTELLAVKEAWKAVGLPYTTQTPFFDLSLSSPRLEDKNYCQNSQYVPIKFKVVNSGTVTYTPSMMGTITLNSWSQGTLTIDLNSPIAPGEVYEVEVNNWFETSQAGFAYLGVSLNLSDDNTDNNQISEYFNITEHPANDLELFAFINKQGPCFTTTNNIVALVTNKSCETVPAGTVLNFTATNDAGNTIWSSPPYVLQQTLSGSRSVVLNYDIPFSSNGINLNLIHANDPNLFNNTNPLYQEIKLPITGNYLNTFEQDNWMDNYLTISSIAFSPTLPYQNSSFFASTGVFDDPSFFQRCEDPLTVFKFPGGEGIYAIISACVDLSLSPNPRLEFDLAQFRNTTADLSNDPYSSVLQAKWEGNENGAQYYLGQPEGQVVHHNVALPPYFKGTLSLRFYTEVGQWDLDPSNLSVDDFLLLDNLQLSAPPLSTTEMSPGSSIHIVPNPATNITTISSNEGLKFIQLQSPNGQILRTLELETEQYRLDLNGLSNGVYFLHIQLANGQRAVKKLVKMD
ncbi:MAG: M4 family metallopeptidase [Saprospiraceae bacterium]|nr:M4 family metallopeptidase [Saprospiraceae bacterium]